MRHRLIVGAIDSIIVIKRHWQADDGDSKDAPIPALFA
jgi:hypothetical protein